MLNDQNLENANISQNMIVTIRFGDCKVSGERTDDMFSLVNVSKSFISPDFVGDP